MTRFSSFPYYASQAFLGVSAVVAVLQALNIDNVSYSTLIIGFPLEVSNREFQKMLSTHKPFNTINIKLDIIY